MREHNTTHSCQHIRAQANATRIEDLLQARMQGLPFGGPRLWRCRGKGSKYIAPLPRVHKAFITFSWKARSLIRKKQIMVNA